MGVLASGDSLILRMTTCTHVSHQQHAVKQTIEATGCFLDVLQQVILAPMLVY